MKIQWLAVLLLTVICLYNPKSVWAGGDWSGRDWRGRIDYCNQRYDSSNENEFKKFINCLWTGENLKNNDETEKSTGSQKYVGINQTAWNGLMNKGCDPGSSWKKVGFWACFQD